MCHWEALEDLSGKREGSKEEDADWAEEGRTVLQKSPAQDVAGGRQVYAIGLEQTPAIVGGVEQWGSPQGMSACVSKVGCKAVRETETEGH